MECNKQLTQAVVYLLVLIIIIFSLKSLTDYIKDHVSMESDAAKENLQMPIKDLTALHAQLKEKPKAYCNMAKMYDMKYKSNLSQNCQDEILNSSDISLEQERISEESNKKNKELEEEQQKDFWDYLPTWPVIFWSILAIMGTTIVTKLTEIIMVFFCTILKKCIHLKK